MNGEYANFGHPQQWPFPSPNHTPNSAGVSGPPQYQGPVQNAEGHFANAWCTPDLSGTQTPAGTPITQKFPGPHHGGYQLQTPVTPQDPGHQHTHPPATSVPQTAQNTAAPGPDPDATPRASSKAQSKGQLLRQNGMDPYQVQTPPPTRDPSGQRRQYNAQTMMIQQQTPSHPTSDMLSTPGYANFNMQQQHQLQQTPTIVTPQNNFSTYNFSSADFQFAHAGPMSAPPVPNRQFMWDQSPAPHGFMHYPQSAVHHNNFAPSIPVSPTFVGWPAANPSPMEAPGNFQNFNTPFSSQDAAGGADFWMSSNTNSQPQQPQQPQHPQQPQQPQHPHQLHQPPPPVMQSQILSSNVPTPGLDPSAMQNFAPPMSLHQLPITRTPMTQSIPPKAPEQPHPKVTPKEKESAKKSRLGPKTPAAQSVPPRPVLQRSVTDGGPRASQRNSREIPIATLQPADPVPRRSSPLKRSSQMNLAAIPETSAKKPRIRTRLVIDENGRATTIQVNEDDDSIPQQKTLMSSWADDDTSEDDDDVPIISARNSFVVAPSESFSVSRKHSRNVSDDMGPSSVKRPLSRQLSSASLASLNQRLQQTPLASKHNKDMRRTSGSSFGGVVDSSSSSRRVSVDVPADAQAALRRVMDDRKSRQGTPRSLWPA